MTLTVLVASGLGPLASPAQAADPPAGWVNHRILDCGGQTVDTYLTPGGFGTPFHVVGAAT